MGTTQNKCVTCGAQPREGARFCDSCGSPITAAAVPAEYKQVTVLFADVVRSMTLAPGFAQDYDLAIVTARAVDVTSWATTVLYKYSAIVSGVFLADDTAAHDTAEALAAAQRSGDRFAATQARLAHGVVLVHREGSERDRGADLLTQVREVALAKLFSQSAVDIVDIALAKFRAEADDHGSAITLCTNTIDRLDAAGDKLWPGAATCTLVGALLARGGAGDIDAAAAATEHLATLPTEPGYALHEIPLLRCRALLARARGDDTDYTALVSRYRVRATELDYAGHRELAATM
ncbi:zinc ribbon domain-containing protein [Mycolicibacterium mengxianglii]|uniref:zinc ribbon domain-containing protein n=1 Tax=Mycolicibacterium mengxianglii TaxID=2736649 RepID=UPI0018EF0818|nr:zinc ribbon domain-containing protein [Mycolicibacterium mengxianglii]